MDSYFVVHLHPLIACGVRRRRRPWPHTYALGSFQQPQDRADACSSTSYTIMENQQTMLEDEEKMHILSDNQTTKRTVSTVASITVEYR